MIEAEARSLTVANSRSQYSRSYDESKPHVQQQPSTLRTGVDGFVTIAEGCKAGGALLRPGVERFKKDLEPEFQVLLDRLGEPRLVRRKPPYPAFFFELFFPGHVHLKHVTVSVSRVRGRKGGFAALNPPYSFLPCDFTFPPSPFTSKFF